MNAATKPSLRALLDLTALFAAPLLPGPAHAWQASPSVDANKAQRDARMHWWRQARFGVFIRWKLYSVPVGCYHEGPIGMACTLRCALVGSHADMVLALGLNGSVEEYWKKGGQNVEAAGLELFQNLHVSGCFGLLGK